MADPTESQSRRCPLCRCGDARQLYAVDRTGAQAGQWTLVECVRCRMVYLDAGLSYQAQVRDFDWAQTFQIETRRRRREAPVAHAVGRGIHRLKQIAGRNSGSKMMQVVLRHKNSGWLCDFGCGRGGLLEQASQWFRLWGIEISPSHAAIAARRLPHARILVGPVTEAKLPASSFDAITLQSYLEHEQRPLAALRLALDALKPDGILAVKVPNYGSWNRRIRGRRWCGFRFPDHCNYFTRRSLTLALSMTGFQPLPGSLLDRLPTSDNMYLAARKRQAPPLRRAA